MYTVNPKINNQLSIWLIAMFIIISIMIVVGGLTRLTDSGLSITEWQLFSGLLPPLNQNDWILYFNLYKEIPEFKLQNFNMTLQEFKVIFWWEYFHRLLGRLIGLVFFVPFAYFLIRRRLNSDITTRLIGIFALGGLQGAMGWYMVASGLVDDPNVSQYRLTAHLGIAFLIFGAITWTTLSILYPSRANLSPPVRNMYKFSMIVNGVIFLMVLSGGFVAGLRAGLIYNTFPLMGDNFIPPDLFVLSQHQLLPYYFHNVLMIQTYQLILVCHHILEYNIYMS